MQSVFKNPTRHALTKNIHVLRKIIRVIRAIRVQKPYASRNSKEYPRPQTEKESVVLSPPPPTSPHNSKSIIIHVLNSLQYSCFKAVFDFVYSDVVLVSAKEDLRVYFMFVCFFFDV